MARKRLRSFDFLRQLELVAVSSFADHGRCRAGHGRGTAAREVVA